jgi:hypothetical protein
VCAVVCGGAYRGLQVEEVEEVAPHKVCEHVAPQERRAAVALLGSGTDERTAQEAVGPAQALAVAAQQRATVGQEGAARRAKGRAASLLRHLNERAPPAGSGQHRILVKPRNKVSHYRRNQRLHACMLVRSCACACACVSLAEGHVRSGWRVRGRRSCRRRGTTGAARTRRAQDPPFPSPHCSAAITPPHNDTHTTHDTRHTTHTRRTVS